MPYRLCQLSGQKGVRSSRLERGDGRNAGHHRSDCRHFPASAEADCRRAGAGRREVAPYYHGSDEHERVQRHFSYSDRIRYYWPLPDAPVWICAIGTVWRFVVATDTDQPIPCQVLRGCGRHGAAHRTPTDSSIGPISS